MKKIIVLITCLLIVSSAHASSYYKAKQEMYATNEKSTFYCGCDWDNKKVNLSSCNTGLPQGKRESRTEAEHIIPASWLLRVNGKLRQCAIDGKRILKTSQYSRKVSEYCIKHDKSFKQAYTDPVNLKPAIGRINADRSNKPFVNEVKRIHKTYGQCTAVSGRYGFAPPNHRKGEIAQIASYMSKKYGIRYSASQTKIFNEWRNQTPNTKPQMTNTKPQTPNTLYKKSITEKNAYLKKMNHH